MRPNGGVNAGAVLPRDRARPEARQLDNADEEASEALGRIVGWAENLALLNGTAVEAKAGRLVAHCTELRAYIADNEGVLIERFTGRLHLRRTAEEKQPLLQRLDRIEG